MSAEFDKHAATYDGGLDNPIKRLLGRSPDQFIAVKARWLVRREKRLRDGGLSLLDSGSYEVETDYMMFMPPGIKFLRSIDRALAWLPLGAQYAVAARKST